MAVVRHPGAGSVPAPNGTIICTSSTRPVGPYIGMTIYETDTGKTMIYASATASWQPPWDTAWGELGYKEINGNVTGFGATVADITGLTGLSVTMVGNRLITFESRLVLSQNTSQGTTKVYITDASNNSYGMIVDDVLAAGVRRTQFGSFRYAPAAAATTSFKARISTSAGTVDVLATAGPIGVGTADILPGYIRILDEGPNGAPVP